MASIKEERTKNKHLSFKIRVCLAREISGKQISKAMRWHPPEGMTPAKARKEVQTVAEIWEAEQLEAYELQKAADVEEAKAEYTFGRFVDEVWIPLCVRDGSHRPSSVHFNFLSWLLAFSDWSQPLFVLRCFPLFFMYLL